MRGVVLWLGLALIACHGAPDRQAELAGCQLISKSGDELARCLVMKYSWRAESAGPAKTAWQWQLDSIRLEHEAQAQAVLAEQVSRQRARVAAQNRLFRSCVLQFLRSPNVIDSVPARGDESPIEAIVRICATRFPDADPLATTNRDYVDSLMIAWAGRQIR